MIEVRQMQLHELDEAVRISDEIFQREARKKRSMGKVYPLVFSPRLFSHSFGVFQDGQLISFMGLVPSTIKIGSASLKIFSLGPVGTLPDYRKRGHASEVLRAVLKYIDTADASLLFVSGRLELYRKANCHLYGSIHEFVLDNGSAAAILQGSDHYNDITIRELRSTDMLKLTEIANSRSVCYKQSVEDLALLLDAAAPAHHRWQNYKVLVAEQKGRLTGFVVVGVPYSREWNQDANGKARPLAYEWGGDANATSILFARAVQLYGLSELVVPVPWHEKELITELSQSRCSQRPNTGTTHVVNSERLIAQLRPYLMDKRPNTCDQLQVKLLENGHTRVNVEDQEVVLDQEAFISLLFDTDPKINITGSLHPTLKSLFPVPLPYNLGINFV
jgi:predicted N-acetyltransferase YhbS